MTSISNDYVGFLEFGDIGCLIDGLFELVDTLPGFSGDFYRSKVEDRRIALRINCRLINLIPYRDEDAFFYTRSNIVDFCLAREAIENPKYDACFANGLICTLYADLFYNVGGLANAGCINESKLYAVNINGVFNGVACGAM